MPGGGHSNSEAIRAIGAVVALIAVVGYLIFGWSFDGSGSTTATAIGAIVAVSAPGWTVYSVYPDRERG
jgi:hypothetical protein